MGDKEGERGKGHRGGGQRSHQGIVTGEDGAVNQEQVLGCRGNAGVRWDSGTWMV